MADVLGSVEKIIRIALAIKKAAETVRRNEQECREIARRVQRVSALLLQLQGTEAIIEDPAMGAALEALGEKLARALELVTECQQGHAVRRFLGARDLARQLREVKQDISDHMVDGIFATNIRATIMLMNIQHHAARPSPLDEIQTPPEVVDAHASVGYRRRFIEALAPIFGRILEADPIFCRRATVLSISGTFTFLVHFAIPLDFPKQQPVLMLQSSQHCDADGTPMIKTPINDYPWSPVWDTTEMVERIYDFLADECQTFKEYCSYTYATQDVLRSEVKGEENNNIPAEHQASSPPLPFACSASKDLSVGNMIGKGGSNIVDKVVDASASIGSRRCFIEALAPIFGRPLEADPISCRRATVLSISGTFTFLVHFAIPLDFPRKQPVLTLQSSQHCNADGIPIITTPINDYPWSPRWEPTTMVERIYYFLADECQTFKKYCGYAIAG